MLVEVQVLEWGIRVKLLGVREVVGRGGVGEREGLRDFRWGGMDRMWNGE